MESPENLEAVLSELAEDRKDNTFQHPLAASSLHTTEGRKSYCNYLIEQLGPRYAECSFNNYMVYEQKAGNNRPSQREVCDQIMDFARNLPARSREGGGIVLYGQPGTGKDHQLAALMFWAVLRYGWTVRWVNGLELYQQAREVVMGEGSESQFMQRLTAPQVLAISDPLPPKGGTTEYQAEIVQRILDHRYRHLRPTWCTMNVHGGLEAADRLAAPIVDRLRHGSLCLECGWESYRKARTD
jgi:DNA replication protein DnaC